MTRYNLVFRRCSMLSAALLVIGISATPAAAQQLPAARELVARFAKETGGEAYAAKKSVHSIGEFAIPAAGLSGPLEIWSARPNRATMRVEIPGLGEMRTGYTGEHAWSINPMEGARLMLESEAKQAADEADFESHLRSEKLIASMETVEKTTIGGQDCYKVKLTWKSGRESFDCYSTETGLLVAALGKQESNMGTVDVTTLFQEYKDFGDGIRMPSRLSIQMLGMEQIITLKEAHFDVVADSAFEPPAAVKALIKK